MLRFWEATLKIQSENFSFLTLNFYENLIYMDYTLLIMKTQMVTVSKAENKSKIIKVDHEFIQQIVESLEDAKHGRIRRVL